ncbi:FAD-dependent monooxygenase [Castellaniella sp.]|uniref:FAD-dependent monooxygenase n=1 Tax=Castellaniella sp. TaxID=1955812 RepID=UPI002AFFC44C|nr:FAD-dependent monooxygenase [Castellaniella sp.]
MQFHHHGYISGEPRIRPATGTGIDRPETLPDTMDVLIVGAGPAGHIAAAQLAQFPGIHTRMIERRGERLNLGHADGIQSRSVETFQAFGFAERVMQEGYHITAMAFWTPDPDNPKNIIRSGLPADGSYQISEFPHLIVNQARIQDYFAEAMMNAPAKIKIDFGWQFVSLQVHDDQDYPVEIQLRGSALAQEGLERTVRAKYVIGCDGAHSKVRTAIGRVMSGSESMHAWGVMDVVASTDFPDIRTKCAIQSHDGGNILLIPREGGYLFRMYVDLGVIDEHNAKSIRATPIQDIAARANQIIHPYTLQVKNVAWFSVYEVAHRLTDHFDDVDQADIGTRSPRVFITGDACHTHSAKAGQGMNVSMQDGFNIAWKIAHVLDGRSPAALLDTYSAERQVVASDLIRFDREWSTLMATPPDQLQDPAEVEKYYVKTFEFPSGFMTQYTPSMITGGQQHQNLASGYPVGKRFKSSPVVRVCDMNVLELGHQAPADGRWRIYAFADQTAPGQASALTDFADWLAADPHSPIVRTPATLDPDAWIDAKVIYQQRFDTVNINMVPAVFKPLVGPYALQDYEKVFAASTGPGGDGSDIFTERGISRDGAIVIVRPDQYVAHVLPLSAHQDVGAFFDAVLGPIAP